MIGPNDLSIEAVIRSLNELSISANIWARKKGFWHVPVDLKEPLGSVVSKEAFDWLRKLMKSQKIMLVVTELAELVEGLRKPVLGQLEDFTNEEEEIADAIIRLLDYSGEYSLRIGEAVVAKMAFNEGRPYQHNKSF